MSQIYRSDQFDRDFHETSNRAFFTPIFQKRFPPIPVEFDYQFPRHGARCIPRGLFTRLKVAGRRKKKKNFVQFEVVTRSCCRWFPASGFCAPSKMTFISELRFHPLPLPLPSIQLRVSSWEGREVSGPSPETFHENWTEIRPVNVDYDSLERSQRR